MKTLTEHVLPGAGCDSGVQLAPKQILHFRQLPMPIQFSATKRAFWHETLFQNYTPAQWKFLLTPLLRPCQLITPLFPTPERRHPNEHQLLERPRCTGDWHTTNRSLISFLERDEKWTNVARHFIPLFLLRQPLPLTKNVPSSMMLLTKHSCLQ